MKNKDDSRKQLVEALKGAENILVTVNANPSVDELSAALGLALVLDKLDKHATAVFSGKIPRAIDFLDPEKTFEDTTHSLQDFIIALDKEKADHLRYKVDGDMVKIFITPYRTVIGEEDLEFSQGDYNVETIVTIGAQSVDDLDKALADHGRIMHDAKVASISIGDLNSDLGTITIHDQNASSYSEIVASLAEDLRDNKSLLDEQSATAILTGIVAATDRFSNERTTAESMTLAAQLMAAGANQQLIATHLDDAANEDEPKDNEPDEDDNAPTDSGSDDTDAPEAEESVKDQPAADGSISISHDKPVSDSSDTSDTAPDQGDESQKEAPTDNVEQTANEVAEENQAAAASEAEASLAELAKQSNGSPDPAAAPSTAEDELSKQLDAIGATTPAPEANDLAQALTVEPSVSRDEVTEPAFGGILNATAEEAADEKRLATQEDRNHTILTHGGGAYVDSANAPQAGVNSFSQPALGDAEPPVTDIFGGAAPTSQVAPLQPIGEPVTAPIESPVPPAEDVNVITQAAPETSSALDAVNAAFDGAAPATTPAPFGAPAPSTDTNAGLPPLPPLPPMPDFSSLPPLPPMPDAATTPVSDVSQSAPVFEQPIQPQPVYTDPVIQSTPADQMVDSLLPPLPDAAMSTTSYEQPVQQTNDPAQFQIPGQS